MHEPKGGKKGRSIHIFDFFQGFGEFLLLRDAKGVGGVNTERVLANLGIHKDLGISSRGLGQQEVKVTSRREHNRLGVFEFEVDHISDETCTEVVQITAEYRAKLPNELFKFGENNRW